MAAQRTALELSVRPLAASFLSLFDGDDDRRLHDDLPHVVLFSKDSHLHARAVFHILGRRHAHSHTHSHTHRVIVTNCDNVRRNLDVTYTSAPRGIIVDVSENLRVMDGIHAFLLEVSATRAVTRGKRIVVVLRADLLSSTCLWALRKTVDKASSTTLFVFCSLSKSRLDDSLTSRFLHVNMCPPMDSMHYNRQEQEEQENHGHQEKDGVRRLLSRLLRIRRLSDLHGFKVPRVLLEKGLHVFLHVVLDVVRELSDSNSPALRTKKGGLRKGVVCLRSPSDAHFSTLVEQLCEVEHSSVADMPDGRSDRVDCVVLACALAYVRLAVCASS
jgi:hypothetical protein